MPDKPVVEKVKKIIAESEGTELPLDELNSLKKTLKMDDLAIIELSLKLEEAFDITIPREDEILFEQVKDVCAYIEDRLHKKSLCAVKSTIIEILAEKGQKIKKKNIPKDKMLKNLNLNEIDRHMLILQLEETLHIMILDQEASQAKTVGDIARLAVKKLAT